MKKNMLTSWTPGADSFFEGRKDLCRAYKNGDVDDDVLNEFKNFLKCVKSRVQALSIVLPFSTQDFFKSH